MKEQIRTQVKECVSKIVIKKRGTPEGDKQRRDFESRWGVKVESL